MYRLSSLPRPVTLFATALTLSACSTTAPTAVTPPAPVAESSGPLSYPVSDPIADAEWRFHGLDLGERRYSPLDQVTTENVGTLQVAWSYPLRKNGARVEATPIVADGVMYATGPVSTVFALDAATGEEIWAWDPGIPTQANGGPPACCGLVNRGVALWEDKIFVGLLDGRLVALDRADGSVVWTVQTTPAGDYTITGAPRVFRGKVVIGNGGAEYGVRGFVTAYDAETGEELWRTYTVPGNPADGFESEVMRRAAETWTGTWWEVGGGGTVWDAMAYDGAANLLYIGVGNGAPWSREFRSPGGGDNLFLASIVALDGDTGEYRWHYQTAPGDDWDFTATQPLMLLDLMIDGRLRQVITQAPKNGFFYVIDRLTGELLSAETFADAVTWATEIDPESGRPVETAAARYGMNRQGAWLSPGPTGAHNWQPMAFSEVTGLVYLPTRNTRCWFEKVDELDYQERQWNTGTTVCRSTDENRPDAPDMGGPPTFLKALDPVTQREAWRFVPEARRRGDGGTLATGGGLVFWGSGRELIALDARTGEELWASQIGRTPGSPATYAVGGRQYITIAGGSGGTQPATIWTFVLGPQQ